MRFPREAFVDIEFKKLMCAHVRNGTARQKEWEMLHEYACESTHESLILNESLMNLRYLSFSPG